MQKEWGRRGKRKPVLHNHGALSGKQQIWMQDVNEGKQKSQNSAELCKKGTRTLNIKDNSQQKWWEEQSCMIQDYNALYNTTTGQQEEAHVVYKCQLWRSLKMIKENNYLKIKERNCYYFYQQPLCDSGVQTVKKNRLCQKLINSRTAWPRISSNFINWSKKKTKKNTLLLCTMLLSQFNDRQEEKNSNL